MRQPIFARDRSAVRILLFGGNSLVADLRRLGEVVLISKWTRYAAAMISGVVLLLSSPSMDSRKGFSPLERLLEQFELDGRVSSHEPVLNKPYQAQVEEVHVRYNPFQTARAFGTQYRDSRGNVRTDGVYPDPTTPGSTREVTTIFDATTCTTQMRVGRGVVDRTFQTPRNATELETFLATQKQILSAVGGPDLSASEGGPRTNHLGEMTIEGVACWGYRSSDESSGFTCEHWVAMDLALGLSYVARDPEGETVFRIFDLRLSEPDPSLFSIPDNS